MSSSKEQRGRRLSISCNSSSRSNRSRGERGCQSYRKPSRIPMRKVTYGGACSLDGFIAGKDGAVDWLHFSRDAQQIMKDSWKNIDTMLLGRKTFEAAARSGGGGGSFGDIKAYVFSRTLDPKSHPGVQIISEDAGTFVRRLKQSEGKDICVMGGGELARSLFDAGAI